MTTIASTRDAMAAAKTRMEKAVDDFRKDLATLRTGVRIPLCSIAFAWIIMARPCGESARHRDDPGADDDRGFAVGSERGAAH